MVGAAAATAIVAGGSAWASARGLCFACRLRQAPRRRAIQARASGQQQQPRRQRRQHAEAAAALRRSAAPGMVAHNAASLIWRHCAHMAAAARAGSGDGSGKADGGSGQLDGGGGGGSGGPAWLTVQRDGGVAVAVHAKPGARQAAITSLAGNAVGVAIDAPAREGDANAALVEYIAEVVGVKKRHVTLGLGAKSRHKVVIIQEATAEAVLAALEKACKPLQ